MCGIKLEYRGMMPVVISAYIRHTSADAEYRLSTALYHASKISPLIHIEIDSNVHSDLWRSAEFQLDRIWAMVEDVLSECGILMWI